MIKDAIGVEFWCRVCGARDGEFDEFLEEHLGLCFCEPEGEHSGKMRDFDILCSACAVARLPFHQEEPQRARLLISIRWPAGTFFVTACIT